MKLFNNSLTINKDLYDYLNEINYGLSKNQMNNLYSLVEGIITVKGNKSIRRVSNEVITARESSSLYRYLKNSKWTDEVINHNRLSYLNMFFENNIKSEEVAFLIIDDTVNPKKKARCMEGLSYNHSHTEGKSIKSHCIVSSQFVSGSVSIPLDNKIYLSKENCVKHNRDFSAKPDIAGSFIENFSKPSNCKEIYCLVDAWYSSEKLIKKCFENHMHLIGAIRSNRIVIPNFTAMQVGKFFEALPKDIFDVVTIGDVDYKTLEFTAKLGKKGNIPVKVVLSYEVKKTGDIIPMHIISTDTSLSAKQIISYYLKRWNIEVDYKNFKSNLGFDEYKIRNLKAIERYLLIVFLAMNFLQIYKYNSSGSLETLGICIEDFINARFKSVIDYIYNASLTGYSLEYIYQSLKIAS